MVRAMKDIGVEWIGEIPEGWKRVKLKDLAHSFYSGGTPTATDSDLYSSNIQNPFFVNISDMSKNAFVHSAEKRLTEAGIENKNLKLVPKGNLLYGMYASVGVVSELCTDSYISQAILSFGFDNDFTKKFAKYTLELLRDNISYYSNGTTQKNVNAETVKNFPIALPTLEEQQRIANFLDEKTAHLDSIIANTTESIIAYKQYKQALITETVTKGLNKDARMKPSGIEWIGEIPEHWGFVPLKKITSMNDDTLPQNTPENHVIKYVDIGSVSLMNGVENVETMHFKDAPSRARRLVSKGDIIVSTVRTYLKSIATIEDDNLVVSTGFAVIRPKNVHSKYLSYYLKSDVFTERVKMYSWGIAYPSINSSELEVIKVTLPPNDEQKQIANVLDEKVGHIDSLIANKEKLVKELEAYKKTMIYEYVTGKKEVL